MKASARTGRVFVPVRAGLPSGQWVPWLARLVVSLLLLGLLLRTIEPEALLRTLRAARPLPLFLTLLLFFPAQLLAAWRWRFVLDRLGQRVPFGPVLRYNLLGQLSALVLPGQASGDVVRLLAIVRGRRDPLLLGLSVLIDKIALLAAMTACVLLGAGRPGPLAQLAYVYPPALFLSLAAIVALAWLARWRSPSLSLRLGMAACGRPRLARLAALVSGWSRLPRLSGLQIAAILGLAAALQALNAVGSYLTARALGITIDPLTWAAINAVIALAQVLPLSIGGLGVREGLWVGILGLYGISPAQATAYSLVGFVAAALLTLFAWLACAHAERRRGQASIKPHHWPHHWLARRNR